MRRPNLLWLLTIGAICLWGGVASAEASTITFAFTGRLTQIGAPPTVDGNFLGFAVGDTFAGTLTFDSGIADSDSNPNLGIYDSGPLTSPYPLQLQIRGFDFKSSVARQTVDDGALDPAEVSYVMSARPGLCFCVVAPANVITFAVNVALGSSNTALLSSDDLLLLPFPLSGADLLNRFTLTYAWTGPNSPDSNPIGQVFGMLDSLRLEDATDPGAAVPEPATLSLLGVGLAGMGMRRWRQRKSV